MRLNSQPRSVAVGQPDRGDEPAKSKVAERLLSGGRHRSHGRPSRTQPAAQETCNQCAAAASERQPNGSNLDAKETCEQARCDTQGKECNIGAVSRTHDLANLTGCAFDVAGAADQRHDVADVDLGVGAQWNLSAHSRKRAQEYATRAVANDFGDLPDRPAMEPAVVDQHLNDIAVDRAQDLVSMDLGTNEGCGRDNGCGLAGNDDVVAILEHRLEVRLDIGSFTHNSLDDGSAANLVLDRPDGTACAGRHAIRPRLEFAISEILRLRRATTGEFRLELGSLLFQVDPHELWCDKRDEQQREDIPKHVSDCIARGDVCLLRLQHVLGKSELCQRSGCSADYRGLRQSARGKTGCGARIKRKHESETENEAKAGTAKHERQRYLRKGSHAQGGKELRARPVADREHKHAKQDDPQHWRKRKSAELPYQDGNDECAGRCSYCKSANPDTTEDGTYGYGQQQKYFRSGGDDPLDCIHD